MSMKLRDLIRKVRACKTAAEERAVIAKESAMIRTAIREEQEHYRHRNVAKLLFMHMLGYPTHFGQLECMKLTASPHFPEKRIGYLGMMLLLTEEADVLMLATNSLKNDLNSDNKFVAGLSLCAIGNLATADMSRDLVPEVDKHLKSSLPYLRKKACLAMARCLAKCPDMVEDFVDRVVTLLKDKSHGVLITVVQLMTQVLLIDMKNAEEEGQNPFETSCRKSFLRLVPTLVKMLRNLLTMGYSPEHDVGGISDPFLQVQLLTLLRLLGINDAKASEEMNDVLAQVATNTETSKNAGNAILYECVQTIMAVESEDSLRVLAVNILGRFLLNRDNNIRYVALNTLSRCIAEEQQSGRDEIVANAGDNANNASSALQRHRTTIVDCLKDPDVSIRQRALELIYHLVNADNVESLTAELLNYLVLCPREHRADICTRVLRVVDRFSPDDRWRVDTLITMLTIAGRESTRDVLSATSIYISRASPDIQAYATHRLLKAIRDDDGSQRGLLSVGIWCIGEFGDYLLQPYSYDASSGSNSLTSNGGAASSGPTKVSFMALDATTVVSTVDDVIKRHSCPEDVKQRAITCFAKLSERFSDKGDQAALEQLHNLVKKHETSFSLELQLRSCEYDALLNAVKGIKTSVKPVSDDFFAVTNGDSGVSTKVSSAAKEALARMPVVDLKVMQRRQASDEGGEDGEPNARAPVASKAKAGGDLLDLDDIFGGTTTSVPATQIIANKSSNGVAAKSDLDLLSDIFSAPMPATPAVPVPSMGYDPFSALPAQPAPIPAVNPLDLFGAPPAPVSMAPTSSPIDLFGSTTLSQPAVSSTPVVSTTQPLSGVSEPASGSVMIPGFSHGGLTVEFECTKPDVWNKQKSTLVALFKNTTDAPLYGVNLQCAVPKYVTMEMQPPDSTTVPVTVGNSAKLVTQKINVTNSMLGTKSLMLKLKVGFTSKGTKIEHLATCSGFPAGQY